MPMKVRDIAAAIEESAPLAIQEGFDNSGLIVGSSDDEVGSALIAVDITEEVMDEAERLGVGMVISHHPIIFHALKRLNGTTYVQRVVERAIRKGIALYACHTNLDAVRGGMSYQLAEMLGVGGLTLLSHSAADPEAGFGVVGELPKPVAAMDFMRHMKERLGLQVIRHSDICRDTISRVSVCTGSGASLIDAAARAEADIYIAADFKYNDFLDADSRLIIADIGHFESEYCAIDLLYDIITKKITTFALHKSEHSRNPVNYIF